MQTHNKKEGYKKQSTKHNTFWKSKFTFIIIKTDLLWLLIIKVILNFIFMENRSNF